jgi:hypothetical protein
MKKIAGIILVVLVLVGAPTAWHYHSPIPFLPPFPGGEQQPPVSTDPLGEVDSQGSLSDSLTPENPEQALDPATPAVPLDALPVPAAESLPENGDNATLAPEDEVFTLEAVEASDEASGESQELSPTLPDENSPSSMLDATMPPPPPVFP